MLKTLKVILRKPNHGPNYGYITPALRQIALENQFYVMDSKYIYNDPFTLVDQSTLSLTYSTLDDHQNYPDWSVISFQPTDYPPAPILLCHSLLKRSPQRHPNSESPLKPPHARR
jgi:hypothetical protein